MARNQIRTGALFSYLNVAVVALTGLIYTPWFIQTIGAESYGLYSLVYSIIGFFVMDFGLGEATSRFMSRCYAQGNPEMANRIYTFICKAYLVVDLFIFAAFFLVFLFMDNIYANLGAENLVYLRRMFLAVAIYSLVAFPFSPVGGALYSNERFIVLNLLSLLQKTFTVICAVIVLLAGGGALEVILVNVSVGTVFIICRLIAAKRYTDVHLVPGKTEGIAKDVLGFSAWSMVTAICQRLIFTIMPTILAIVSDSWQIALFGLTTSMENYVYVAASALNGMFLPKVSRLLEGQSPAEEIQQLAVRQGRIQLYIIGAIFLGFFCLGQRFIVCWLDESYLALFACVLVVVFPTLIDLPLIIAGMALTASGGVRERAIAYILMALVNIGLGFWFSYLWGALGASISICIAYLVRTVGLCYIYRRNLGFKVKSFYKDTFGTWVIPAVIATVLSWLLSHFLPLQGWLGFILCFVLFVVFYLFFMYRMSFDDYEKGLAKDLLGKFKRKGRRWK